MPIRVLDSHTAELIAAGEVVERPSSVVKELVENAIDAGASRISVEIERGGIALILVRDDGCGIPAAEVPLAFLRHATSKVQEEADLEAICTLGFRGEALASIASVSRMELLSHAAGEDDATRYRIEGGRELACEEAAGPAGTTFSVRDLFYNTPARMKFLKKDASEGTYVTETVGRLALSHPEIAFAYTREGKEVFATPGDGKLESAIYAVLGREFAAGLLPVAGGRPPYAVGGFVTPPLAGRGSRSMQYFFVGGRFVKNRTMMAALEQAYRGSAMQGRFPGCVLFLEMPPQLVDVNVHPAKTEVRFANEKDVFSAVYGAVKDALAANEANHGALRLRSAGAAAGGGSGAPEGGAAAPPVQTSLGGGVKPAGAGTGAASQQRGERPAGREEIRAYRGMLDSLASSQSVAVYETVRGRTGPPPVPPNERLLDIRPEEEGAAAEGSAPADSVAAGPAAPTAEPPAQGETAGRGETVVPVPADNAGLPGPKDTAGELRYVGEVFATYILAEAGDTMYLIDKHAAHERLLYEKLAKERLAGGAQQLLVPVAVQLAAGEKEALLENSELLLDSGIELEDFGAGGVMVRAAPADVGHSDIEGLVAEVARGLATGSERVKDHKTEWVLHSMACRAAIKAGDRTAPEQLLHLARQIVSGAIPPFCPHGRPCVLEITRKELEKQFGRLG